MAVVKTIKVQLYADGQKIKVKEKLELSTGMIIVVLLSSWDEKDIKNYFNIQ